MAKRNIFQNVPMNKPRRSAFDLSHERKFSMNFGDLIPIMSRAVVPGDTFRNNTEVLVRLSPMLAPIMHRVNVFTHFFFVPNRLIWKEFEDFITGGADGQLSPVHPFISSSGAVGSNFQPGSLADYLGVPTIDSAQNLKTKVNALPFRAYQEIYNQYYRDQNLEDEIDFVKTSGSAGNWSPNLLGLRKRCWEKDYFTSALPWTQRGGDVTLPMSGNAPVNTVGTNPQFFTKDSDGTIIANNDVVSGTGGRIQDTSGNNAHVTLGYELEADLSGVSAATIEELRRATKLQKWLENNARGGSRYIEQIMSRFGVRSSDARLQRPEFLGGGRTPLVISEVLQTSSSDATSDQGNMAGHAVAVGNSHTFKKFFEEHGWVIGIMSVVPKTSYQQGFDRELLKDDKFDYYQPEFAQLGEQPIYKGEIFATNDDAHDREDVFGYQQRYSEYKYVPSTVHGDFKDTLSYWHMGRIFSLEPTLSESFVKVNVDERNFPVQDGSDKLYVQCFNNLKAIRPMPFNNVPSL